MTKANPLNGMRDLRGDIMDDVRKASAAGVLYGEPLNMSAGNLSAILTARLGCHFAARSPAASDAWARDEQAKRHEVEDQLVVARSSLAEAKEAAAVIEGWALQSFSFASECDDGNQPKEADAERAIGREYRRSAELVLAALNKPYDPRFQPAVSQTELFTDPDEGSDLDKLATLICELADHPRPSLDFALCMVTAWHKAWRAAAAVERAEKDAEFLRQAQAVVDLIEKPPGYGTQRNADGVRLKDQPEWVAFYNSVKARTLASDGGMQ